MELKLVKKYLEMRHLLCLNRTFYGIETSLNLDYYDVVKVLIVPFMELKLILLILY